MSKCSHEISQCSHVKIYPVEKTISGRNEFSPKEKTIFTLSSIPLGTCIQCGVKQGQPGRGGFWIGGSSTKWARRDCKYGTHPTIRAPPIKSYPVACEWCSFIGVIWNQGHTYMCPRCRFLGIRNN